MTRGTSLKADLKQQRSVRQEATRAKRVAAWRLFAADPDLSGGLIAERLGTYSSNVNRWKKEWLAGGEP